MSEQPRNISVVEAAQLALGFLNRAQLTGQEVDVFAVARQLLQSIVAGDLVVGSKPTDAPPPGEAANDAPPTSSDATPLRRTGT